MTALIAGVGNVLLGDDGFGVEVVRRMPTLPGVRTQDFGVRALHLAYELLEPWTAVLVVDAMDRRAPPGTLFVLEPDVDVFPEPAVPDAHGLHPAAVLRLARDLGAQLGHVRVIGCQPEVLDEHIGLSGPVERAVPEAVRILHALLAELAGQGQREGGVACR